MPGIRIHGKRFLFHNTFYYRLDKCLENLLLCHKNRSSNNYVVIRRTLPPNPIHPRFLNRPQIIRLRDIRHTLFLNGEYINSWR